MSLLTSSCAQCEVVGVGVADSSDCEGRDRDAVLVRIQGIIQREALLARRLSAFVTESALKRGEIVSKVGVIRAAVDSSERGCLVAFDGGVSAVVKRVEAEAEALSVLREQLAGRMAVGEWFDSDDGGVGESVGDDDDGSGKTVDVAVGVDVLVRTVGECWRVVSSCSEDPDEVGLSVALGGLEAVEKVRVDWDCVVCMY